MAFVNDYLSDDEMEMFKKLNISYPLSTGKNGIIGYTNNAYKLKATKRKCTIDREEEIYFFYCGTEKYDKENVPKYHYFYLLWNKEFGDDIVTIVLEQMYKYINDNHTEYIICWKKKNCYFEISNRKVDNIILAKIKEALAVYGISGYPKNQATKPKAEFDF